MVVRMWLLALPFCIGRVPGLLRSYISRLDERPPRVANKAQARLYATLRRDGSTRAMQPDMQTRADLYVMIGLHAYEELDASIVKTVLPGERSPVDSTSQP